jgi:hypothetical protein
MSEQDRMSHPQTGDAAVSQARADREQRLAHDEAQLAAGACPGHDEQTIWHSGQPTPAEQMKTHGAPAPSVPDEGGHQSASDPIG